jgi:hypothetical protein
MQLPTIMLLLLPRRNGVLRYDLRVDLRPYKSKLLAAAATLDAF